MSALAAIRKRTLSLAPSTVWSNCSVNGPFAERQLGERRDNCGGVDCSRAYLRWDPPGRRAYPMPERAFVLAVGCLPWPSVAVATPFIVPGDFPTIQAAINAAVTGDEVRGSPTALRRRLQPQLGLCWQPCLRWRLAQRPARHWRSAILPKGASFHSQLRRLSTSRRRAVVVPWWTVHDPERAPGSAFRAEPSSVRNHPQCANLHPSQQHAFGTNGGQAADLLDAGRVRR